MQEISATGARTGEKIPSRPVFSSKTKFVENLDGPEASSTSAPTPHLDISNLPESRASAELDKELPHMDSEALNDLAAREIGEHLESLTVLTEDLKLNDVAASPSSNLSDVGSSERSRAKAEDELTESNLTNPPRSAGDISINECFKSQITVMPDHTRLTGTVSSHVHSPGVSRASMFDNCGDDSYLYRGSVSALPSTPSRLAASPGAHQPIHVHHHVTAIPESACLVWEVRDFLTFRMAAKHSAIPPLVSHPFGGGCTLRIWPWDGESNHVRGIVDIPASKWCRDGAAHFTVSVLGQAGSHPHVPHGSAPSTPKTAERPVIVSRRVEVRIERGQYNKSSATFRLTSDRSLLRSGTKVEQLVSPDGTLTLRAEMDYFPFDSCVFKALNQTAVRRLQGSLVAKKALAARAQSAILSDAGNITNRSSLETPRKGFASLIATNCPRPSSELPMMGNEWHSYSTAGGVLSDAGGGGEVGPVCGTQLDATFSAHDAYSGDGMSPRQVGSVCEAFRDLDAAQTLLGKCTGDSNLTPQRMGSQYHTLLQDMAEFCRSEATERIELRCQGRSIVASRTLLMARSRKLRELIKNSKTAHQQVAAQKGSIDSSFGVEDNLALLTSQTTPLSRKAKKELAKKNSSSSPVRSGGRTMSIVGGFLIINDINPNVLEQIVQYISTDMCDWIDGGCESAVREPVLAANISVGAADQIPDTSTLLYRNSAATVAMSEPSLKTQQQSTGMVGHGKQRSAHVSRPRLAGSLEERMNCSRGSPDVVQRAETEGEILDKWETTVAEDEDPFASALSPRMRSKRAFTSTVVHMRSAPTSFENSIALFTAACEYQIPGLIYLAGNVLTTHHLRKHTIVEVWDAAQSCDYEPLKEQCMEYMNRIPGSEVMSMLRGSKDTSRPLTNLNT